MMSGKFRYFNVVFILALLLGFVPASGYAPRAQAAPADLEPASRAARLAPEVGPTPAPVAAPAAPQAPQAAAFPPPSGLSVDERLRLNGSELFDTGVAAVDTVNGFGYFAVTGGSANSSARVIVKVNLADRTRVGVMGLWPNDHPTDEPWAIVFALADPQRDMLYLGISGDPARVVRVRLSTFKRVDAITLPAGITLGDYDAPGAALMTPDGNSAYLLTDHGRGLIHVSLPDFVVRRGTSWTPTWCTNLTLDQANGRIYLDCGNRHIVEVDLADMSWKSATWYEDGLPLIDTGPVLDVARGLAYYGDIEVGGTVKIYQVRLSDMTLLTTTLDIPPYVTNQYDYPSLRSIGISPDSAYAYFFIKDGNANPYLGIFLRIQLSDFTYKDARQIEGNFLPESFVMPPGPGTVFVGWQNDQYPDYDPNGISAYWGDYGGTGCALWAFAETATTLMLDAANDSVYFFGKVDQYYRDSDYSTTIDWGLIKVRLSDFTEAGRTEAVAQDYLSSMDTTHTYLGGGIDLLNGYIHLALEYSGLHTGYYPYYRFAALPVPALAPIGTFDLPNPLQPFYEFNKVSTEDSLYDLLQGVLYVVINEPFGSPYQLTRYQMGETARVTETKTVTAPLGALLAVDGLHDHVYLYSTDSATIIKVDGTELITEATLPMTLTYSYALPLALDPLNDTGYLVGAYSDSLYKLRLSDLSVVMSRTIPYPDIMPDGYVYNQGNVTLDTASGYGYFLAEGHETNYLIQFRLNDLAVTSYVDLEAGALSMEQSMVVDPDGGAIYIIAGRGTLGSPSWEILKIGLSGGKSVTPASNVPYHGVVTYTLNLAGHLTLTDTHVVLTDTLPAEVDFLNWVEQPAGATVADDVIHWSGPLNPREVVTLTFTAQHTGDYYNDTVLNTAIYSGTVVRRTMRATFQVESPPPLPIVKTVTPTEAAPGAPVVYTLRFTNTTGVAAANVVITDILPATLENVQVSSPLSLTARAGTQYVWDVNDGLAAFASGVITITGNLAADTPAGALTNTAALLGVTDGVTHTHRASAVLTVTGGAPPALAISKTAEEMSAPPLLVGDRILYTIRVTNTTTGTLTNLVITDTLPAGVTFFEVPKGPSRPFTRNGQQVVWERTSLAAGDSLTLQVIGKATGDPTPIGDNTATATCAEDTTPRTATANLGDPTVQEALTLLKDAVDLNGAPLLVNDVIRYTLYVTNAHATVTMTHVVVTDTLPAGTVFVSATQPYTEADGVLWWQVGNLAPGASWTAAVDQRVTGAVNPIAGNIAAVCSDQQDWQETGEVTPPDPVIQTALKVSKTAAEHQNAPPLYENDQILYTIHVTNTGSAPLTNLIITDTLPAGVAFYNVPKSSRPFTHAGQQVVWMRGPLAAGASLTLEVIGVVDGSANPIGANQVVATCAEEAAPASAGAQVPGDGVHEPGMVISGTVGGGGGTLAATPFAAQADQWVYAVTLTNTNATHTMHNVIVSATLPSGVTLISATPPTYTGVTTLTWTLAELGPGAAWQASLTVAQTGAMGALRLAAASAEQSPVEISIAPPGGMTYTIYLPVIVRQS